MTANTKIEWADATWNPITGCSPVSEGCANCYAARMAKRLAGRCGYDADDPFQVTIHRDRLDDPLRWRKARRVFVCSMGDLFHEDVPFHKISAVWDVMFDAPQHTYMILTKRPARAAEFASWMDDVGRRIDYPNVWLGVTAENQTMLDKRVPALFSIPAAVRFVSCEPLLGLVDLRFEAAWDLTDSGFAHGPAVINLDWVICGSESGPGARPMHSDWARALRDQCVAAGVPFFLKQMDVDGELVKLPALDGRVWDQTP